eukprot:8606292-Ditylum_brightwellii.AAC.1
MCKKSWFIAKYIRQKERQNGNKQGNLSGRSRTVMEVEEINDLKLMKHHFTNAQRTEKSCTETGHPEVKDRQHEAMQFICTDIEKYMALFMKKRSSEHTISTRECRNPQ